jgi:nitrogenase molybdenum-iron protein beta chain
MSSILQQDRNGCALHGALKLLDAIEGVVPIVHASAGCGLNAHFADNAPHAAAGRHFRGVHETSATTLYEKHVVFGGTSRLREQIKNTLKVLNGDLYAVVSGCVPEVVGDDVPAMVKEARDQRFPVIGVSAPGFKGNAYVGYEIATRGVFEGLAGLFETNGEPRADRVNLLGVVPGQDIFWEGDLLELETLLGSIGLEANRLVGIGQEVKHWKDALRARLSLVVSPWGLEAARFLRERFGIPYLHFGWLPAGGRDAGRLLEKVGAALEIEEEIIDGVLRRLERQTRYFLQKAASVWVREDLQKRVAIVAPSALAVGLARFLSGTLGQIVRLAVLTDEPPETCRDDLCSALYERAPDTRIVFAACRGEIAEHLAESRPEVILGSDLEREDAGRLGAAWVEVAAPARRTLVLNRGCIGLGGALALFERFAESILRHDAARAEHPLAKVIAPVQWKGARSDGGDVAQSAVRSVDIHFLLERKAE